MIRASSLPACWILWINSALARRRSRERLIEHKDKMEIDARCYVLFVSQNVYFGLEAYLHRILDYAFFQCLRAIFAGRGDTPAVPPDVGLRSGIAVGLSPVIRGLVIARMRMHIEWTNHEAAARL